MDNGSTDDSLRTAEPFLANAEVIRLNENVGFARANNLAAQAAARRRMRWRSSIRMRLPSRAGSRRSSTAAERTPAVAAFASQMRLDAAPEYLDGAATAITSRAAPGAIGISSAASAAGRRPRSTCSRPAPRRRSTGGRPSTKSAGSTSGIFCYFEDVDLGFRLRLRGHRCVYVPDAIVRHVSSALSGYRSDFAVYHGERNAVWTFVKNMPAPLFWFYLPQHLALNLASLGYYPWRGQGRVVWRAKRDAMLGLPAALRERRAVQQQRRVEWRALRRAMVRGITAPYRQPLRFRHGGSSDRSAIEPMSELGRDYTPARILA